MSILRESLLAIANIEQLLYCYKLVILKIYTLKTGGVMIIIALIGFDKSGGLIQEGIIELLRKNFAQVAILEMEEPVEINPEVLLVGTSFHEKDASAIRSSLLLDSLKVLPAKEDFFEEKHGTLNLERRNSFKRALKFKAPPRRHWHRKL